MSWEVGPRTWLGGRHCPKVKVVYSLLAKLQQFVLIVNLSELDLCMDKVWLILIKLYVFKD